MRRAGILAILLLLVAAPCFAEKQAGNDQGIWSYRQEIEKIVDPMLENMLVNLNSGDYAQYSRDFGRQMKAALPESKFEEMSAATTAKLGKYVSKEFISIELRENYIVVSYKGEFSQEKEPILIRSVFAQENGKTVVAGFWLKRLQYLGNVGTP